MKKLPSDFISLFYPIPEEETHSDETEQLLNLVGISNGAINLLVKAYEATYCSENC